MKHCARQPRASRMLVAALFIAACAAPVAGALDVSDGRIKLSLLEASGRFSLSGQAKGANGAFVPLLAYQDPRTTVLSIVVGNKVYRMGESSDFSQKAERTAGGARFVWKSAFLQVTETFTFIASDGSPVTNGVQIDIAMKNLSDQEQKAGVRCLFDTYLGESSFIQFRTDSLSQMAHEMALTPADQAAYWVSPLSGDPDDFGLQVMTAGAGVTVPDRVVFANWKRLSDSSWSFESSPTRNFSQLPYSVNDSAACQYYNPRSLPRDGTLTVTLALGIYARTGFAATASTVQGFTQDVQKSLNAGKSAADAAGAVRADLATVNRILAQLDQAAAAGTPPTGEELALMEAALKDLKARAAGYDQTTGK
jgi:hypothetical protein